MTLPTQSNTESEMHEDYETAGSRPQTPEERGREFPLKGVKGESRNGMNSSLQNDGQHQQQYGGPGKGSQPKSPTATTRYSQRGGVTRPQPRPTSSASSKPVQRPRGGSNATTISRASTTQSRQDDEEERREMERKPTRPGSGAVTASRHPSAPARKTYAAAVKTPPRTSSIQVQVRAVNPARQSRPPPRKLERRGTKRQEEELEMEEYPEESELKLNEARAKVAAKAAKNAVDQEAQIAAFEAQRRSMERLATPRYRRSMIEDAESPSPRVMRSRTATSRAEPRTAHMPPNANDAGRGMMGTNKDLPMRPGNGQQEMRQVGPNMMISGGAGAAHPHMDPRMATMNGIDRVPPHMQMHPHNVHQHPEAHQRPQEQKSQGLFGSITSFLANDDKIERQGRQIQAMHHHIHGLTQQLEHERRKNDALSQNLIDLKSTNDQFEADLREVQVKSFKELSKSSWTPMEDHVIRDILADIHKEIEDWADENCIESFEEMRGKLTEDEANELLDFLKDFTIIVTDDYEQQLEWWSEKNTDPVLLLTATMTHLMYLNMCGNPFQVVDAVVPTHVSAGLWQTYCALADIHAKQANLWRSQLMRILFPKPLVSGRFEGLQASKEEVPFWLRCLCEARVERVLQGPSKAFLKASEDGNSSASDALVDCWVRVTELFTQLQTQLSSVYWSHPKEKSLIGNLYEETFVEAHRCQYTETKKDKPIGLVISPYIQLFGNEDGERYDKWRVVSKAIILVHDDEDFEIVQEEEASEGDE